MCALGGLKNNVLLYCLCILSLREFESLRVNDPLIMKKLTFKKCVAATFALALQITGAFGAILVDVLPQDTTTIDGQKVSLSVYASSDTGKTLTYQWYKDSLAIAGKTANLLTFTAAKASDVGQYQVAITEIGVVGSSLVTDPVTLTVNVRPVISVKPVSYPSAILEGQTATYGVTMNALGTPPFTYTWQRKIGKSYTTLVSIIGTDGAPPVNSGNATASILTPHSAQLGLSDVQLADVGTYRVQVTNITGTVVNSSDFSLKVDSRPVILTQPIADSNLALGSSKTLKVVAGGNKPMTYQWFKNGTPVTKSNSASLTIKGTLETEPATPDVYRVEIFNPISPGFTTPETMTKTVSANANVHVIRKPVIATHPIPASVSIVENPVDHTLSVVMAPTVNPGVYQYQWQKDGKNISDAIITANPSPRVISGAQTSTLSLTPVAWLDRGSYRVIVKNEVGSVTSKSAALKIVSPPVILSQSPPSVFGNVGGSIKLFVVAGGTSAFKYEWFYRPSGGAEFGATPIGKSASLSFSKLTTARDGDYYCKVSNLSNPTTGTVNSAQIFLKVDIAPKITVQTSVVTPAPDGYTAATKVIRGGNVKLQVAVSGTDSIENPLRYRWQKNKKDLVGVPSLPTLDLTSVALTASGKYRCIVSNYSGSVTSKELTITIQDPPAITVQPIDVTQYEDIKLETVAIKATGAATLRYQWEKRITNLDSSFSWTPVIGQKYSKLSISTADALRDSGVYRCRVTNEVGFDLSDEIDINVQLIPVAELGPVTGLSQVEFYPRVARSGEYVRIYGSELRFTKSVKFGTTSATPVIESDNSILVKVPSTAPMTATPMEVVSKRGSAFTSGDFRRTEDYENVFIDWDDLNNATIVPFSSSIKKYNGDNRYSSNLAGSSTDGPVWYLFSVPVNYNLTVQVTGFMTDGKSFDPSISLYEVGRNSNGTYFYGPDEVTEFKWSPTKTSSWIGILSERVEIDARSTNVNVKSKLYMVQVYGETYSWRNSTTPAGKFEMSVAFTKLNPLASKNAEANELDNTTSSSKALDQIDDYQTEISRVAHTTESDEICLGGTDYNESEPVVLGHASRGALCDNSMTTTSFAVSLETGGNQGDDQFSFQVEDVGGQPLLAVWISSSDGSVRLVQPDGTSITSSLVLPLNSDRMPIEITVNPVTSTWSVMINGVAASEPLSLPVGANFGAASAVWDLGEDGASSGASMIFSRFKVEHSVVP